MWMTKDQTASPTVSLEAILLTCIIDAEEGRDVAVVDIPNAFIQTNNEGECLIMKVKGRLAMLLYQIDPGTYWPYLTYEDGVPVLYLEVLKAIYGL